MEWSAVRSDRLVSERKILHPPPYPLGRRLGGLQQPQKNHFSSRKSNTDPLVIKEIAQSQNRLRCLANICPYLATELWLYEPKLAIKLSGPNPNLPYAVQTEFVNTELIHYGLYSDGHR